MLQQQTFPITQHKRLAKMIPITFFVLLTQLHTQTVEPVTIEMLQPNQTRKYRSSSIKHFPKPLETFSTTEFPNIRRIAGDYRISIEPAAELSLIIPRWYSSRAPLQGLELPSASRAIRRGSANPDHALRRRKP